MAIVINGSGTVTGLAVGGLPDGTVDAGTLATDSVTAAKLGTDAVTADALKSDAITGADLPTGSVLQVVQSFYSTAIATTSTSYVTSGLTVNITPSATSSKLLIMSTTTAEANGSGQSGDFALFRGSTNVMSTRFFQGNMAGSPANTNNMNFLDSPSSTSELTYTLKFKATSGSNMVSQRGTSNGTLIIMEIAG